MITAVKRILNAILMYIYLLYYTERLRRDRDFMMSEAEKNVKSIRRAKILRYEKELKWRV